MPNVLKPSAEPDIGRRLFLLHVARACGTSIGIGAVAFIASKTKERSTEAIQLTVARISLKQDLPGTDLQIEITPVPTTMDPSSPAFTLGLRPIDDMGGKHNPISLGEISANEERKFTHANFDVLPEIAALVETYPHLEDNIPPLSVQKISDLINERTDLIEAGAVNLGGKKDFQGSKAAIVSSALRHWSAGRKAALANKTTAD